MTSNQSRPSKGRNADPIKSFRVTVTLAAAEHEGLERRASEMGIAAVRSGRSLSLVLESSTAAEALAKLKLLSELLAPKR